MVRLANQPEQYQKDFHTESVAMIKTIFLVASLVDFDAKSSAG